MNTTFMPMIEKNFALIGSGVAEVVFALVLLTFFRVQWFNYVVIGFGTLATIAISLQLPHIMTGAFNPFSTNLSIVVFAVINLLAANSHESSTSSTPA